MSITNLDIAAEEALGREIDNDPTHAPDDGASFVRGYTVRAQETKDGPWSELIELAGQLRGYASRSAASGIEGVDLVRFIQVPADLLGRIGEALTQIDARNAEDAEPVDVTEPVPAA